MFTRYFLPAVALVTLTFAVVQMTKAQQKPPPVSPPIEPGQSPYTQQLAGAGIVEPETENIAVGSNVPGVVQRVFVTAGQRVKPGERLFELDDRSLKAERAVRRAMRESAAATLAKASHPPRVEEGPAFEAKVREAEANRDDLKQTYDRLSRAAAQSPAAVSADELSRRKLAVAVADAQVARATADQKLWQAGTWAPDRKIAEASVAQADAQVRQTEIEIERLTVTAPWFGWKIVSVGREEPDDAGVEYEVLQVNVRPGEYVGNVAGQALVVLGVVGKLHVRVDLDENDISRFDTRFVGVAKPRGNPNASFPLTFVRVEPYVVPKKSLTGAGTERVDTRVLQVLYALDPKGQPLYVGQQMDVFLNAKE